MASFNKEAARHGNEVIERGQATTFRPFLPQIYWKGSGDEKFILILNRLDDIMRVEFHPYLETDNRGLSIIARTDPGIGERYDPIQQEWGYAPRLTDLMIAVELEPFFESRTVNGRTRESVGGFTVITKTYERRVRNDDGELTDETEEFEIPAIGYIAQSPYNFGNQLNAYENNDNPIHLTPFKITQVGTQSTKQYNLQGYPDAEYDLSNLFALINNTSFVQNPEELDELLYGDAEEHNIEDVEAAALTIGNYILDLKLAELSDPDIYDETLKAITKPPRFTKPVKEESKHSAVAKAQKSVAVREKANTSSETVKKAVVKPGPSARDKIEAIRAQNSRLQKAAA